MATSPAWSDWYRRVDEVTLAHAGELLLELLPGGHREGREYRCGSLEGGPGDSFGFNLESGAWCDFATGEKGGNGIPALHARKHGVSMSDAAHFYARQFGVAAPGPQAVSNNGASPGASGKPKKAKGDGGGSWRVLVPFADSLKDEHWDGVKLPACQDDWGKVTDGWLYLDADGKPWNYRIRFEKKGGSKEYRPLSLCQDERGAKAWKWRDGPIPRPLWNLEKLAQHPEWPVVVVEGERSADAAERLLGPVGYVVVTWPGGASNTGHVEWKPLKERRTTIYLWPDNDEDGQKAANAIYLMFASNADVRIVETDPAWPTKCDLADLEKSGWNTERTVAWLIEHSAPAEMPVTSDAKRPECSLATKDHGVLQGNVWEAVKELNRKKEGPFYYVAENGLNGELKSIRPAPFNERILSTLGIETLRAQITRDLYFSTISQTAGPHPAAPERELLSSLIHVPSDELPGLHRYVRTPVYDKNWRLISTPGYDRMSKIYYAPARWARGIRVPEKPSEAEMVSAMELIEDVLVDFQFATPADHANVYALMLLPILRELIDGPTPMHRIEAPAFGTGKTLLLHIALLPTIENIRILPETADEEEWRKTLVGALREDWPAIIIDNVRHLDSGVLAGLLTAPQRWGARLLGYPDVPQYKVRCVFACTVNNPVWSIEMHRRMLPIRLDSKVENPFERTGWKHPNIKRYVERNRAGILSALLTLARYGMEHQQPFGRTKGSYESWAQVMGPILAGLGFDTFLASDGGDAATVDVEQDGLADLLEAWETQARADANSLMPDDERLKFEAGTDQLYPLAVALETLSLSGRSESDKKRSLWSLLRANREQIKRGRTVIPLRPVNGKARFRLEIVQKD